MVGSDLQRERDVPSRARRFVYPEDQLERLSPRAPVCIGFCVPPEDGEDIPIVSLVAIAVHVRRVAVEGAGELVVRVLVSELPVLHTVYRGSADLHASGL